MGLFSKLFKRKKKKTEEVTVQTTNEAQVTEEVPEAPAPAEIEAPAEDCAPAENCAPAEDCAPAPEQPTENPENDTQENAPAPIAEPVAEQAHAEQPAQKPKAKRAAPKPKKKAEEQEEEKVADMPAFSEEEADPAAETEENKPYTGKFEINRTKDGKKYFFNLFASNKVGIATSQMYASAQSALTGVKSVIVNAPKAPIEDQTLKTYETLPYPKWEIYLDNGNKYRFRLNATNGSCVCHSQGYTTKTACKNGIDSIIRSSRNAEIVKTYLQTD